MIKIPVYQPNLTGHEAQYVNDCLASNWISSKGKYIERFEKAFSTFTDAPYSIAVCNGTVALHLALVALGVGPGDEVIVPTLTYIASVNAITYTGATPVFADCLRATWQLDPADVERKLTPRTKAIMAVHLYGHPCELSELNRIAKENRLLLLEDCAEALGSYYEGTHVGTIGDIGTFSFYGNKTITTGEGGMLTTNNPTLWERAVHFKGQGLAKHREYWHDVVGYNYRMTNLCAAIGLAQLERVEDILARKRAIADLYKLALSGSPYEVQAEGSNVKHSYWMVSILIPEAAQRDAIREHLLKHGIETRPVFYPAHLMPMYSSLYQQHAVSEDIGARGINLPSYPDLKDEEVRFVCETLLAFS
ncbi:MAG: DegT/DnrJ/EryC1/StrS family aminotransferase [Verrucomicrobiota bacterium]|nr:DegT/DnrJ/EryC1/StrS family aminotransferase [Verrucomicrobiota bacterium]